MRSIFYQADFIVNKAHTREIFKYTFISCPIKPKWQVLVQMFFSKCKEVYLCSVVHSSHLCSSPLAASPWDLIIACQIPTTPCVCFPMLHLPLDGWDQMTINHHSTITSLSHRWNSRCTGWDMRAKGNLFHDRIHSHFTTEESVECRWQAMLIVRYLVQEVILIKNP